MRGGGGGEGGRSEGEEGCKLQILAVFNVV